MERIQIESSMGGIVGMFSGVLLVFEWGKNKFAEVRKLKLPAWLDCVRLGEYTHIIAIVCGLSKRARGHRFNPEI